MQLFRNITVVVFSLLVLTTCGSDTTNSTEAQRSVTEYFMADGTRLDALSGAIRASGDDIIARFVAPSGIFTVTTTADAGTEKTFLLDNVSPDGEVSLQIAQVVTSAEVEGCGSTSVVILCQTATAAVGSACPADGCPAGTLCDGGVCQATNALNRCDFVEERVDGFPTRRRLTLTPERCTRTFFDIEPPPVDVTEFVVGGSGDYRDILESVRAEAAAGDIDFVVLLGDNLSGTDAGLVESMTAFAQGYPVPIVAIPGEAESSISDSPRFVGRFGPGDFAFQYGPLRAFAFTSAGRHLGDRGLDRIRSLIRLARARDDGGEQFPLFGFTHVPPMDPNGARDQGFTNEVEAARTMSLLTENGVDLLVAGHIKAADSSAFGDLDVVVTSYDEGIFGDPLELLRIRVGPPDQVSGTSAGEFSYAVDGFEP